MNKKVNKIIFVIVMLYLLVLLKVSSKIIINNQFIKNYPDANQEIRLVLLSTFNFYQPYIAPYNYGNYLYQKGRYNDAYEKYKKALTYKVPKNRLCPITINIGMALTKMSEEKSGDAKKALLEEAKWYLGKCLSLDPEDENPDDYYDEEIGNYNPEENPKDKPKDNSGDKQKDNPGDKQDDKPGDNQSDNPGDNSSDNSGDKQGDNPGDNPGDIASQQQGASELDSQISSQLGETDGDNPGETPSDNSSDKPGETPTDKPGENPGDDGGPSHQKMEQIKEIMEITSDGDPTGHGHEGGMQDGGKSDSGSQKDLGCYNCG